MLTKEKVQSIHQDIQRALNEVAEKHGLNLSKESKISYSDTSFKFTTVLSERVGGVDTDPKLVRNAERFGSFYKLGTEALGKTFNDTRLGIVTYIGMTSRDKAIVKANDGRMYRFNASVVAAKLNA